MQFIFQKVFKGHLLCWEMSEGKKEHSETHHSEKKYSFVKFVGAMKKNPWMPAAVILALVVVVMAFFVFGGSGNVTGKVAADNLINFVKGQTGESATLVSVNDSGSLYEVVVSFKGQDVPVYVTKDGKYLINQPVPITASVVDNPQQSPPEAKEVPKSDKPVAEFYVFTYCPYGTQIEKALVPVYNLLKSKANISIVYIGAMHDSQGCTGVACFEKTESLRQICIRKNYGNDKLFAYLDKLLVNSAVGNCQGKDACVSPIIEGIYSQIGVDKNKVNTCIANDAEAIYQADEAKAQSAGVGGSPTVVINGVQVQVARSPAGVLSAICSAFSNSPAECSQTLSSTSASAGFGSTASSSSTASCG